MTDLQTKLFRKVLCRTPSGIVMWDVITTRDFVTRISVVSWRVTTQVTRARDTWHGWHGALRTLQQDDRVQTMILIPHHRWLTLIMTIVTAPPPVHLETRGLVNFVYITTHPSQLSQTHLAPSSEASLCPVWWYLPGTQIYWQSAHIERGQHSSVCLQGLAGGCLTDSWPHLPSSAAPQKTVEISALRPCSLVTGSTRQHLTSPPGPPCQHSLAPSATAEGCKAAPHIEHRNKIVNFSWIMILTMTWIYGELKYLLQCNGLNIGWMIFRSQEFLYLRKNFQSSEKAKSALLSGNSSSHWFIKHSVVAIMLCCVSAIICQQTVFGYERRDSAHITHFLSSLSGSGQQLFVALCSPPSYRLSLSYRDLLTVMSVLGFHILYSSSIKTVSKYNWILNVYSNLSVEPGPSFNGPMILMKSKHSSYSWILSPSGPCFYPLVSSSLRIISSLIFILV